MLLGWDIVGLLQGSKRPLARKLRKKSEKEFPGPLGPRKKFMCLISWERTQNRDPHKLLRGDFLGQKGGPKRAIFGHKNRSRFLGRGSDEALFSEKKGFSVKRGEGFSE